MFGKQYPGLSWSNKPHSRPDHVVQTDRRRTEDGEERQAERRWKDCKGIPPNKLAPKGA